MMRREQLITPPLSSGILDSITRRTVLELAPEVLEMPVVERDIDRTELYLADELFFLGKGWEILSILEVDGLKIGSIHHLKMDALRSKEADKPLLHPEAWYTLWNIPEKQ